MNRSRLGMLAASVACMTIASVTPPAGARGVTTLTRTIQDTDEDNLLEFASGEPYIVVGGAKGFKPPRKGSIVNFLLMTDFQMIDEESPARVEFLDTSQRPDEFRIFNSGYRPQDPLTTHITEAMVRTVRGMQSPVTRESLDFAILTGDNADSQQFNETRWFIDILDGKQTIEPDSGVPTTDCPGNPSSRYDGVRGGGDDFGYYDPDRSGADADGPGYSPDRDENEASVDSNVTVRDFPGLFEAAQRPFRAVGLGIPWYTAFGNHDALIQGNSPDAYVGPYGPTDTEIYDPRIAEIATGCRKPVLPPEAEGEDDNSTTIVPPDPRRCYLAKDEPGIGTPEPCSSGGWIEQHFRTKGRPRGHGLVPTGDLPKTQQDAAYGRPPEADANNDGYYSFSPAAGLRFVVLDTVTDECGSLFCAEGSVDDTQFRWLESQILKGEEMGQYVIPFAHHTLRTIRWPTTDPTEQPVHYGQRVDRRNTNNPQNPSAVTLEELFCSHPNVIAYVGAHEHDNYVLHHKCAADDPATAGDGEFFQISTAAHLDWPQQSRMIELVDNGDGTVSLVLTIVDHAGPPDPGTAPLKRGGDEVLRLAGIARELSYNDYQKSRAARGEPEDRNLIIRMDRPWPPPQDAT